MSNNDSGYYPPAYQPQNPDSQQGRYEGYAQPQALQPQQQGYYQPNSQPAYPAAPNPFTHPYAAGASFRQPEEKKATQGKKTLPLVAAVALIAALAGGGIGGGIVAAGNHGGSSSPGSSAVTTTNETTASNLSSVVTNGLKKVVTISAIDSSAQEGGTGSGIVIDADKGYIATNAHVVTLDGESGSANITVQTSTGDVYNAKVVGYDATADVAVVQVSGKMRGVETAKFASPSNVKIGTGTIAIGSPLGLSGTVTTGIVSALNRPITVASSAVNDSAATNGESTQTAGGIALNVIQTDASINPGNSGGALFDDNGNVIGMNAAIASTSSGGSGQSGSVGVGFAIPSDYVSRIANDIISTGKGTHGYLGIGLADKTESNSTFTAGAKLTSVTSGSPAADGGLRTGDVVTGFDDTKITSALQLASLIKQEAPGGKATVTYQRDGKESKTTVTLSSSSS